ncbi:MAG: phosphatidylglycerophosphatase A [Bryobacteraceae bacterium]
MGRIATWIATCFGVGYTPKGPGTAGSFAALLFAAPWPRHIVWLAVLSIVPAIWAAHVHAAAKDGKDPQEVVVDEVAGQWIALAGATHLDSITPWIIAFALFRAFDIWKPFPVRQLEKLPGGVGIVMDDVMAGFYAAVVMRLLGWNNLY